MKLRNGDYTLYNNFDIQLLALRRDDPIFTHFALRYYCDDIDYTLEGFNKRGGDGFVKIIERHEIKNAFHVTTKALYYGNVFIAETNYSDQTHSILSTYDLEMSKQLNLFTFYDGLGKPYYGRAIKLSAIEKLWEERSPVYDLPMPKGLELYKEIIIE